MLLLLLLLVLLGVVLLLLLTLLLRLLRLLLLLLLRLMFALLVPGEGETARHRPRSRRRVRGRVLGRLAKVEEGVLHNERPAIEGEALHLREDVREGVHCPRGTNERGAYNQMAVLRS